MDALLPAFLAALLAEQGDTSQLLAALVARRYGVRPAVLAAVTHTLVPYRATSLLLALALLFAGAGALLRARPPKVIL